MRADPFEAWYSPGDCAARTGETAQVWRDRFAEDAGLVAARRFFGTTWRVPWSAISAWLDAPARGLGPIGQREMVKARAFVPRLVSPVPVGRSEGEARRDFLGSEESRPEVQHG